MGDVGGIRRVRRALAVLALGALTAGVLVTAAPAAQAGRNDTLLVARGGSFVTQARVVRSYVIGKGALAATATCWRSSSITVWEKNALGQNLYHTTMNPVTWCASGGKITDVVYSKGTAAADKAPWGFDRWLTHGKVDGCVGCTYIHYKEDAQFKAVTLWLTSYGHTYVDTYFYPDGRYSGSTGGN
jgi:hypothetical protein